MLDYLIQFNLYHQQVTKLELHTPILIIKCLNFMIILYYFCLSFTIFVQLSVISTLRVMISYNDLNIFLLHLIINRNSTHESIVIKYTIYIFNYYVSDFGIKISLN